MISRLHWIALLTLAACASDVALGGPNTLVRVDSVQPGIECPQGGTAINTGLDEDGDAFLDDEEITSTQFVCNGQPAVQCSGGTIVTGTVDVRTAADFAAIADANCVDGDLLIAGTTVTSLPLEDLAVVTGDLVIAGNDALTSLDGLRGLREIGGTIHIQVNDALANISGLSGIKRADEIAIVGNDALVDLRGFESIIELQANLTIKSNASLRSLAGLDNLTISTRPIVIRGNRDLTSVAALSNLRSVGLLEIAGNGALTSINMPSLEKVDVRLMITSNATLASADFPALSTVGDFVRFEIDPALAAVRLPELVVTGSMYVNDNNTLSTLEAPNLVFVTQGIELMALPQLGTVRFDALSSIGTNLFIRETPALSSFASFSKLGSIGGVFIIDRTNAQNFNGFGKLGVVSGDMTVIANSRLNSFVGMDSMQEVGEDLTIVGNPMLSTSRAAQFAGGLTVGGTVTIQ